MKAAVNLPLVLYHTQQAEKDRQLPGLCKALGFRCKKLFPADARRTVAEVCGMWAKKATPAPVPADFVLPELLLFCRLPDKGLDDFLAAYRKAGLPTTALKAVVTQTNAQWSLYQLAKALEQEHLAFLAKP